MEHRKRNIENKTWNRKERKRKVMEQIIQELFELQDKEYQAFHAKLIPNIEPERIIGVRTPALRKYAKEVAKRPEAETFLGELPHQYYEENNLHGFLLPLLYKDVEELLDRIDVFLPYVDNWATCDMMPAKTFRKNLPLVYERAKKWLKSEYTYEIRFGVVTLLGYFLDEAFEPEMLCLVADIRSEEYYIKMAVAWYFSVALVKQYDAALPYFLEPHLDLWTHNKAIQKATESYRITPETKDYLRSLKIKAKGR